ncbi:MAG: hypothetical protein QW724_04710 [Nitrososphaerota archaeon]
MVVVIGGVFTVVVVVLVIEMETSPITISSISKILSSTRPTLVIASTVLTGSTFCLTLKVTVIRTSFGSAGL